MLLNLLKTHSVAGLYTQPTSQVWLACTISFANIGKTLHPPPKKEHLFVLFFIRVAIVMLIKSEKARLRYCIFPLNITYSLVCLKAMF